MSTTSRPKASVTRHGAPESEQKKKGRPRLADERVVYQTLLDAAKVLLDEKGYHRISTREIAARANTNAAMINYYFGGKGGLFVALIESMFEDLHDRIGHLDKSALTRHPHPNELFVTRLQSVYTRWHAVLRLFSSEVVVYNTTMRETFKQRIASVVYTDVLSFLEFMAGKGIYRSDLDLRSMAFLLAGLITVPYHFTPFLSAATSPKTPSSKAPSLPSNQQPINQPAIALAPTVGRAGKMLDAEQWQAALIEILDSLLLQR